MKILGIDPGIGIVGFGLIESDGFSHKMLDAGVIKTKVKDVHERRLKEIYDELSGLVSEFNPDVASVEKLFFSQNVTTAMSVSQARGVILLVLEQAGVPIVEYTPLQIKSSLVGYGKADKAQVQEMVRVLLNLSKRPTPDDCADALGAALTHAMSSNYRDTSP
ncbi:crossover junction endodeoxyribonuclease RuvC [Candidatus Saccharibacteria bacterium]|nr:crossover junction endodeoxyribonuclease RuvC [Candidatus Saccharibacteria bacterium]MCB9820982.1 crossover junction endodeoxyribonuclease RuvC [Candidatus Nomurabacteria bacterium]